MMEITTKYGREGHSSWIGATGINKWVTTVIGRRLFYWTIGNNYRREHEKKVGTPRGGGGGGTPKSGDVTRCVNVVDNLDFPQVCVDKLNVFTDKTMESK